MNAKLIAAVIVAAASALSAPVFAAESVDYGNLATKAGTVTRAEVRAEAVRARAAGELDFTEANYPVITAAPASTLSRSDLRAEVLRARAAGELDITEANFPVLQAAPASMLTRAEVRAEVTRALAAGELTFTEAGVVLARR